jgi:release factor glutamine methyltransferase
VTVQEALVQGIRRLKQAGVKSPELDSVVLLAHALGVTKHTIYIEAGRRIDPRRLSFFHDILERRARREPIQYITGTREFMGLDFEVRPGVMVPRPETETLVEVAQRLIGESGRWPCKAPDYTREPTQLPEGYLLADIGTGSGALAVVLADFLTSVLTEGRGVPPPREAAVPARHSGSPIQPEILPWYLFPMVFATDISSVALGIAKRNAARHHVTGAIVFLEGDMWQPLQDAGLAGRLDAVVSNPPYITSAEMEMLEPEIRLFEPREALDGGEDGLDYYRILASGAPKFLRCGGFIALEVGAGQAGPALALLVAAGLEDCHSVNDLQGIPRVVYGLRA